MSFSEASRISASSGDSVDGTGTGGSGSERTSDDGHAGESNGEHNDSSSSNDDAQSQRDSEGEQGEPQESDAENTASEEAGSVDQDTDREDAASNSSGRSGATDGSSATSEHVSDAGTENNDDGNNSSRKSSDGGRTSRRYPRESAEESETEVRGESGRSGSSKSGHESSSDSDDDSEGAQNEERDERRSPASDEGGEHSDRADENDVSSEGQQSHDEEERLRQERPDGDDTEDDEQSDGDSLAGTKTNDDDDEGDDSGGEGGPDREEKATAATMIQRRVRSRTTKARMDRDMQPRHKAATKIQATARGRHARRNRSNRDRFAGTKIDHDDVDDDSRSEGGSDQEEKATAARRIQRRVRSRTTKARADGDRNMQPRHKAATKIQATARGRHARRNRSNRDRFVGTKIDHDDDDDGCSRGEGGLDREEKTTAARKIQRRVRSRTTNARTDGGGDMQPRHKAATKIQATARGRHARRHYRSRLGSVSSDGGSSDSGTNTNASRAVEGGTINRSTRNLGSPGTEEASAHESSDRADEDDNDDGLVENERDCTSTDGLNLIEGDKLLEQHATRRIQLHARRSLLGGEKEIRTQIPSKPSAERKRKSANRDTDDDELRSMRVPTKPPERDTQGAARDGTGNRYKPACAGQGGASRSIVPMGEDEAARCLQREARRGSASKKQQRGEVRGGVHGTLRKSEALGKDAAARCIQAQLRSGHARRCSQEDRIERKSDGARRKEAGENTDGSFSHPPTSTARTEMNIRGHGLHPDRATRDVQLELTVEHLGAQQQQQQHQQQQPPGFVSPGKAAAAAASAVAKSAAAAAAAAVRAAEAAADAAEAAEAAAAEEEEWSRSVIISSPPIGRESRRKHSPARSAFWLTEGDDKDGPQERRNGGKTNKARPSNGDSGTVETARKGVDGGGRKRSPRHTRGQAGAASERDNRGEVGGNGSGSEDAKLKHAREQAKRHARDRRARAMAKEEDSRRELRAMHADLVKAEELRNKQANAEKSALEAKRARVLDDMNRRQQRLQRLQQEEEALLDRGGHSHQRSSSRSSSADAAVESQPTRLGGGAGDGDDLTERAARDERDTFSLPLISGVRDVGRQPRRKPRHVSTFRERILEERRARKEVDALKRKELEEKHSRQTEYAAKIRAQAKRALAAEQRRAQEDADRSARAYRSGQSVDRTPIAIKRPKQEGEWGVYSYPPDRPPDGLKATNGGVGGRGGGAGGFGRRPAPGYGSTGRVRDRLGSSELRNRMRRERDRATGASRARAADARAAAVEAKAAAGDGSRGYGSSEDGSGGKRRAGFRRDLGSDDGDGAVDNRRAEREGVYRNHHQRPAPPTEQRGVEERLGYGQARRDVGGGGGGRTLGVARSGTKSGRGGGGGAGTPDLQRQHPADGGNSIHAMYEERLAALERRLVHASSDSRSFHEGRGGGLAVGSDSSVAIGKRGGGEGARARKPPLPLRSEGKWGTENNPFGYRESPAEHGRGGFARIPDYGGAVNGGESTSGREVEVEGLSTMYMGPISHKMARLRATNKA